jgi:hypothetical protein
MAKLPDIARFICPRTTSANPEAPQSDSGDVTQLSVHPGALLAGAFPRDGFELLTVAGAIKGELDRTSNDALGGTSDGYLENIFAFQFCPKWLQPDHGARCGAGCIKMLSGARFSDTLKLEVEDKKEAEKVAEKP